MKKLLTVFLVVVLIVVLCACSNASKNETVTTTGGDSEKVIAVLPWDMAEEFATAFIKAAEKEVEAKGWKFVTYDPQGDWNKCVQILEDLIVQKVDGIIYTAIDAGAAGLMVDKVKEANIPIIDYDALAEKGNSDASVACDDYKGGVMAAEAVMEALNGKEDATVIIYEEDPAIATSGKRNNGFTDYLDKNYPNVKYIKNRGLDNTRDGCRAWAVDMYTAYPEVDAIFAYWGDGALGAWNGLQQVGASEVYVVGYDATDEQRQLMLDQGPDSKFFASVAMYPEQFAEKTVELMGLIFEGKYERKGPEDIVVFEPELIRAKDYKQWQ